MKIIRVIIKYVPNGTEPYVSTLGPPAGASFWSEGGGLDVTIRRRQKRAGELTLLLGWFSKRILAPITPPPSSASLLNHIIFLYLYM